jgi:pyruvate-formate lyase
MRVRVRRTWNNHAAKAQNNKESKKQRGITAVTAIVGLVKSGGNRPRGRPHGHAMKGEH